MNVEVDTREYVTVLKEMTEQGLEVAMTVSGTSMEPFLTHERDKIYFRKAEGLMKKGDMVFFQRKTGEYVMHRIMKVGISSITWPEITRLFWKVLLKHSRYLQR